MTANFYFLAVCALLLAIATAIPVTEEEMLQPAGENTIRFIEKLFARIETFRNLTMSRFRVDDHLKVDQCSVQPAVEVVKFTTELGRELLETKLEGRNVITALLNVTAEDRSKELICTAKIELQTDLDSPVKLVKPELELKFSFGDE